MSEFVEIFNVGDITTEIWSKIAERLKNGQKIELKKRYFRIKRRTLAFPGKPFEGIIIFLLKKSNGQIQNEIKITSSEL